jgi:integrase/recombinase XerD
VNDIQVKYRLSGQELTPDLLRSEFKNPSKYLNFIEWARAEIRDRKGMISASTIVMQYSIMKCLEKFQKVILFSEIDLRFLERFEKFLKLTEKNRVDTISKKMRCLRLYLNRAKRNNIIRNNPFDQFKIKKGKGRIIYLEEAELKRMIDLYGRELAPRNMKKVLRYFLFSCVTGLRLGDVKRLRHENIINDTIIIVPQKKINTDHETVTIPLCQAARRIILESGIHRVKGRIFDCYSDPVTNRYLKDIATLLKIQKLITFHTSRHTFATLFLEKTNDLASLSKLMGHASIMQTMVYAHVSETKKREQIRVFDQIF